MASKKKVVKEIEWKQGLSDAELGMYSLDDNVVEVSIVGMDELIENINKVANQLHRLADAIENTNN
jgi:uncharacterized protein Yka (UPF0111/DUF47 family)